MRAKGKTISRYMPLFFIGSYIGFIWEVLVCMVMDGFQNSVIDLLLHYRGVLHGPWVPIYGFGLLLLAWIWNVASQSKLRIFLYSVLSCGILEYVSGWLLETLFHRKWWDYTGAFLSINGRVCFVSVFGFALIGTIVIVLIMPCYLRLIEKCQERLIHIINFTFGSLFIFDVAYSLILLGKAVISL